MLFDFFSSLAQPSFAAWIGVALAISICSITWWLGERSFATRNPQRYWRGVALLAELCASVGLIGLVTYAGRERGDFLQVEYATQVRDSERTLSETQSALWQTTCIRPVEMTSRLRGSGPIHRLCDVLRSSLAKYNPDTDWRFVQEKFTEITRAPDFDARLIAPTQLVVRSIEQMTQARNTLAGYQGQAQAVRVGSNSWGFLLFAAALAIAAVALKCARAASEFKEA
ncbi:hypothetical protein [Variovorax sp. OV700]|uniref:hypothetical protein n=1 Tax=Variovorax sp. OV700 TaxID=1882826 RepID=UPI00088CD254|nr:hypothetical protein [Variovorax sp. OV700]SDH56059.1 hypothetical protein SAMN05444748_101701 [Variovorax sp. OV700]